MAVRTEYANELVLMEGECVDATLDLGDDRNGSAPGRADNLVLTDRRLIHVSSDGRRKQASFVSIQDITGIDVRSDRSLSVGGYMWGVLSLIVAVAVWRTWDNAIGSAMAGVVLAAMGVYLVVDRLLSPSTVRASFRTGNAVLKYSVNGPNAVTDTYEFVNKLFLRKERVGSRTFSPR